MKAKIAGKLFLVIQGKTPQSSNYCSLNSKVISPKQIDVVEQQQVRLFFVYIPCAFNINPMNLSLKNCNKVAIILNYSARFRTKLGNLCAIIREIRAVIREVMCRL